MRLRDLTGAALAGLLFSACGSDTDESAEDRASVRHSRASKAEWPDDPAMLAAFKPVYQSTITEALARLDEERSTRDKDLTALLKRSVDNDKHGLFAYTWALADFEHFNHDRISEAARLLQQSQLNYGRYGDNGATQSGFPTDRLLEQSYQWPLEYLIVALGSLPAENWNQDFYQEVALRRKADFLDYLQLGGEQYVYETAVKMAARKLGYEGIPVDLGRVSDEWKSFEEARAEQVRAHHDHIVELLDKYDLLASS